MNYNRIFDKIDEMVKTEYQKKLQSQSRFQSRKNFQRLHRTYN